MIKGSSIDNLTIKQINFYSRTGRQLTAAYKSHYHFHKKDYEQ
jgi:hypothetical protein